MQAIGAGCGMESGTSFDYQGRFGPILRIALVNGLLTLLTLGVYRFWATAKLRRYVWGSVRLGGDAFEYTGTGLEKFLGFLVAVVVLAVYLGLVQIVLFLFGVVLVAEPRNAAEATMQALALSLSALAAVPFVFFAQYRARRYKLARTRFRGIRFGMEPAAWGYVWRALGHGVLTVVTLGLLLPRQTFALEAYMTNRSFFGDARFAQGGRWTALYRPFRHVLIGAAILIGGGAVAVLAPDAGALAGVLGTVGFVWISLGFVHYTVQSFAYLATHKTLGAEVAFRARPKSGRVIEIWVGGIIAIAVTLFIFGAIAIAAFADVFGETMARGGDLPVAVAIAGVIGYVAAFVLAGALGTALISQPILRHYVETLGIEGVGALEVIAQRAADRGADAEGFADALDVGGGF